MQPHHTFLSQPVVTKPKRRTVHLDVSSYDRRLRASPDGVHIRELTVSQAGLGCAIWDGSILLARWLHRRPALLADRVGMELGAGVGLPGIVAARVARRVVLSDYLEEAVANLAYNLKLNANVEQEDEEDETRDEAEISRRRSLRANVRAVASAAMLDWHAIDPDDEDLARMREEEQAKRKAEDEERLDDKKELPLPAPAQPTPVDWSAYNLGFTPSTHFTDPTGLGCCSCDFLLGSELIYTENEHHQTCFRKILTFYLKPGGVYYCVQSLNREGMPAFVQSLLTHGWSVHWQSIEAASGITGNFRLGEKVVKGFVQREEQYTLYIIRKPGGEGELDLDALSLTGGRLLDARVHPVPRVQMLRDAAAVEREEKAEVTPAGEKLVQQLLPKAFAQMSVESKSDENVASCSSSSITITPALH